MVMQAKLLPHNGYKTVYRERDPDLGLNCVLRCSVECLDAEVLLYPLELDLEVFWVGSEARGRTPSLG